MKREPNEIKIRISGLSNGIHEYHFEVQPADLLLPEEFNSPVKIDVELDKETRQIFLKARVAASGLFVCDRCLDQFTQKIASQFSLFYVFSELDSGKFPADDVRVISPDTMYIDITDDTRQSILLTVPLKLLCREDCKGLCPHCGMNWNLKSCDCHQGDEIDTRWERLKKIQR